MRRGRPDTRFRTQKKDKLKMKRREFLSKSEAFVAAAALPVGAFGAPAAQKSEIVISYRRSFGHFRMRHDFGTSCRFCVEALEEVIAKHGAPQIFNTEPRRPPQLPPPVAGANSPTWRWRDAR
jgi:hypothetical protein